MVQGCKRTKTNQPSMRQQLQPPRAVLPAVAAQTQRGVCHRGAWVSWLPAKPAPMAAAVHGSSSRLPLLPLTVPTNAPRTKAALLQQRPPWWTTRRLRQLLQLAAFDFVIAWCCNHLTALTAAPCSQLPIQSSKSGMWSASLTDPSPQQPPATCEQLQLATVGASHHGCQGAKGRLHKRH